MRKPTKKTVSFTLSALLFLLTMSLKANNIKKPLPQDGFILTKLNSFELKSNDIIYKKNIDNLLVNKNNDGISLKEKINLTRTDKGKLIFQLRSNGYLRNQDITISMV